MSLVIILISVTSALLTISPIILSSSYTSPMLLSQFSAKYPVISISSQSPSELTSSLQNLEFDLILDLTLQQSLYPLLDQVSAYFGVVYLSISPPSALSYSSLRVNVHGSYQQEASAIANLLEYLQWTGAALACSSNHESLTLANNIFRIAEDRVGLFLKYSPEMEQATADKLIGMMIKAKGYKKMIVIDQGESLGRIENSIENKKLVGTGNGIILPSKAIFIENLNFALIVVEPGLEFSDSPENYDFLAINNTISDILSEIMSLGILYIEKNTITQLIKSKYPNHTSVTSYSLVNIQTSGKVIVGSITDLTNITGVIYFQGNTTSPEVSAVTSITLSIANGTDEIYDLQIYYLFAYFYQGARYAVMRSNALNEIPGFQFTLFPTDCGNFLYDPYWFNQCYSPIKDKLGVAYLSPFWADPAYGALVTLEELGVNIPQISPFAQADKLDNSTAFPQFLKLSLTMADYLSNGFIFLKSLGWNSVSVLATDDETFYSMYQSVLQVIAVSGVTIVNPMDKQVFPANYTRDDFETYRSYFQAVKDSHCRMVLILATERGYIWEGLYDIGLRRGDIYFLQDSAAVTHLQSVEGEYLMKRAELALYSFILTYNQFIGDLGIQLQTEMSAILPDLSYMCMTYDTVSVVKEAIIYALSRGEDYEDPNIIQKAMRTNRLTGCLGSVYFGSESNSRISGQFLIQQLFQAPETGDFYLDSMAIVDKLSTQIIDILQPPVWPTGNSTTPSLFRPISLCPFDSFQIIESTSGQNVLYAVSVVFFVVSCLSAWLSYRYSNTNFEMLTEKQITSFADMIFVSYFVFQFFQLLAEGPDQDSYKYLVQNFQILVSMDFAMYFQLTFSMFWHIFYAVLAFTIIWILLCAVVMFRCEVAFQENFICSQIKFLTELVLPFLGHIGFVPILSMMMNIFLCNNAIGTGLTDSYLDADCTVFCYTGKHKLLAVISGISILLYISSVVYCRIIWESTQISLHLSTKTIYLCLLSVFQVVVVILNKTLKEYSQIAHGCTVSALLTCFIVLTLVMKPYNYPRSNVMQITSLVSALWGIITSTVFREIGTITIWVLTEFIGLIVIVIVGASIMMRHPAMLYAKKGKDISTLFLFQFCKDYEKYIRDHKSLEFSAKYSSYRIRKGSDE